MTMNKQNLLTLTLIISGLTLNPVMAETAHHTVIQNKTINKSITSSISTILHNRGLDEDAAEELAGNLVDEEDEMFLALMLQALEVKNIVSRDEVLEYLSTAALHREKLDLKKYDNLVGMVTNIKKQGLDVHTLRQLGYIVKMHKELFV